MTIREYLFGRRIVLVSPHSHEKVRLLLKQETTLGINPFKRGVSGGFFLGQLRLAWDIPLFSNGFRPVFVGRLSDNRGGTTLRASYGAPFHVLGFLGMWYGFLIIFMLLGAALLFGEQNETGDSWIIFLVLPLFVFMPLGVHLVFNSRANAHYEGILEYLARTAGLRPEQRKGRRK